MTSELRKLPDRFSAGTSVEYRRTLPGYPANDGWTLEVFLSGKSLRVAKAGGTGLEGTVTADGEDFLVEFPAAATAGIEPGGYTWVERVTKAGKPKDAAIGTAIVQRNLATAYAGEAQTYNERELARIDAAIDAYHRDPTTATLESWTIANRGGQRTTIQDMYKLRAQCAAAVDRERNRNRPRAMTVVRFTEAGL